MQLPEASEKQLYNLNNELAKERTRATADRTLMAWTRTSFSLIGFGFGIPTIVLTIEATRIGIGNSTVLMYLNALRLAADPIGNRTNCTCQDRTD